MGDHMKPQGMHPYGTAITHPAQGGYLLNNYNNQQFYHPNPSSATPQQPQHHRNYPPSYGSVPPYNPQSSPNDFRSPHDIAMAQQSVNKQQLPQPAPNYVFQTPNSSYSSEVRFSGHRPLGHPTNFGQDQTLRPTVQSQEQFIGSRPPTPSNFNPGFQQNQTQYWTQMPNNQQPAVPFAHPGSRPDSGLRREQMPQVNRGQPPVGHQQPNSFPSPVTYNNSINTTQRFPTENAVQNASLQQNSQRFVSNPAIEENFSKGHPGSANSFAAQPPSLKPANGPQSVVREAPSASANYGQNEDGCPMLSNPLLKTTPDSGKISAQARPTDQPRKANVSSFTGKDHREGGETACNNEEEDDDDEYSDEITETYSSASGSSNRNQQLQRQIASKVASHQHRQNAPVGHGHARAAKPSPEKYNNPRSYETSFQRMNFENSQMCVDLLKEQNLAAELDYEESLPPLPETLKRYNCPADIMASTLNVVPNSSTLLKKARLPFGILMQPLKDIHRFPMSPHMVKCRFCHTQVNPFVEIVNQRGWRCSTCCRISDFPEDYLYESGPKERRYTEGRHRPDLGGPCYEYLLEERTEKGKERFSPTYVFLIDVSFNAIQTGYLSVICEQLLENLTALCRDRSSRVCFLTFNSHLQFYNLHHSLSQPQVYDVADLEDVSPPSPHMLVNVFQSLEMLKTFLKLLPSIHKDNEDVGNCLGVAMNAACKLLDGIGGRVTVFQTKIPDVGVGALKSREDPNKRAADQIEHLAPANDFYKNMAMKCTTERVGFDLFFFNSQYVDMASITPVYKFTGGCLEYFPNFHIESNPVELERFRNSFKRYLTREVAFRASLKIRCTRGLSFQAFHGSGFVRTLEMFELPISNADSSFGVQVAIDEDIEDKRVCFQTLFIYMNSRGERRARVSNLCLLVKHDLTDVLYNANQLAVVSFVAKMAANMTFTGSVADSREALTNVASDLLEAFGKTLSDSIKLQQLPCPYLLRALPLFVVALMKSKAFRLGISTKLDDRVYALEQFKTLPWPDLLQLVHPHLYPLHVVDEKDAMQIEDKFFCHPSMLPLTSGALRKQGIYLLDTGVYMYLFMSPSVNRQLLRDVLGVTQFGSLGEGLIELPVLDNPISENIRNFIEYLNGLRHVPSPLILLRDDGRDRDLFYDQLVEDRTKDSMNMSYVEFLRSLQERLC